MEMKRKSVISVLLILAMVLTVSAFASCTTSEKEETIMVHMKITSTTGGNEEFGENDLALTGTVSELTVLAATHKMCVDVLEIKFDYDKDIDAVKRIGANISELFINEYDEEIPAETEAQEEAQEPEEGEEGEEAETTTEEAVKDFYYEWVCTIN